MKAWWWCPDPPSQAWPSEFRFKAFWSISTEWSMGSSKVFCPFLYSQESRGPSYTHTHTHTHTHNLHHQYWNWAGPCGGPGHKSLSMSPDSRLQEIQEIGFLQPPRPSLRSKEEVQIDANQGREGMRRQGRGSQETIAQPGGRGPAPPSRDTHHSIFELFCRHGNPHQVGEVSCALPTSTETPDRLEPEGWWCRLPITSPATNQKKVHGLVMSSLNHSCKTPHYPLQAGHTVSRALARCGPLCLARQ